MTSSPNITTWISFASFSDELHKMAAGEKIPIDKANARIFTLLFKGSPVKIRVTPEAAKFGGGYYDQVKKEIGISEKHYDTLAHEIGHAKVDQHIIGRIIQSRVARVASGIVPGVLAGIGAGLLVAKGKKWGVLLPSVLAAPTILSEALATREGRKLIEEYGGTQEQKDQYRAKMREGLMSYLMTPLLGTLIASAR